MPYDPLGFFKAGQEIGKSKYSGFTKATDTVMDAFKTRGERQGKLADAIALERAKNSLPMNEKDQAQTDLYKSQSAWMKGISGMPEEEGLVLDSVGKSGPRYINAKARLEQKSLGEQASQLPKLNRALGAVQSLRSQYERSIKPASIQPGSNPFLGMLTKGAQGSTNKLGAVSGSNPEMNRYNANKEGFASLISKGGFMEAGVLTNEDIQRMTNILPNEFSSKEEADIAWKEIEDILSAASRQFQQNSGPMGRADSAQDASDTPKQITREDALAELRRRGHKV